MKEPSTFTIVPVSDKHEFSIVTSPQLIIHNAICVILASMAFYFGTISALSVIALILGNTIGTFILFLVCRVRRSERFTWKQIVQIVKRVEDIEKAVKQKIKK